VNVQRSCLVRHLRDAYREDLLIYQRASGWEQITAPSGRLASFQIVLKINPMAEVLIKLRKLCCSSQFLNIRWGDNRRATLFCHKNVPRVNAAIHTVLCLTRKS